MGHTLGFLSFSHNLRKQYLLGLKCLHTSIIIFIIISYCNIISIVSLINSSPILVELHETIVSAHNAANFFVPIGREKALMIPIFCTCLAVTLILILEQLTNYSLSLSVSLCLSVCLSVCLSLSLNCKYIEENISCNLQLKTIFFNSVEKICC